jgi:regulator of protease activity HflC (stomatin/prohibitin superfamily)
LPGISFERFATGLRADFRFAPVNALLLVLIYVAGLIVHLSLYPFSVIAVELALGSAVVLAILLRLTQVWEAAVLLGTADALVIFLQLRPESEALLITAVVAMFVAPSVQIAYQWERAVILRLGRFKALRESGPFLIVPIVDKVAQFVDQRVRVSDFSAETTLTADTVPVNVDAIAFWMVWDAQKAVLEVEHFEDAVIMSAQTALRNAIGKNDLADLLSERDRLGHEVQKVLDEKTSGWGITTQAVEIRDIIIPKGLEDAMSRQAQAERERQSRIILGTAETEIAEKFASASALPQQPGRPSPARHEHGVRGAAAEGLDDHRAVDGGGNHGARRAGRPDRLRAGHRRGSGGERARWGRRGRRADGEPRELLGRSVQGSDCLSDGSGSSGPIRRLPLQVVDAVPQSAGVPQRNRVTRRLARNAISNYTTDYYRVVTDR